MERRHDTRRNRALINRSAKWWIPDRISRMGRIRGKEIWLWGAILERTPSAPLSPDQQLGDRQRAEQQRHRSRRLWDVREQSGQRYSGGVRKPGGEAHRGPLGGGPRLGARPQRIPPLLPSDDI